MDDLNNIIKNALGKEPEAEAWNTVNVNVFGFLEMQNKWGHITETQFKSSMHWLLMKYLLIDPRREVPESEIYGLVWPAKNTEQEDTAARVRLRRMREALRPLKLDNAREFLLYSGGVFRLSDKYVIRKNDAQLIALAEQLRDIDADDPRGLDICGRALDIYRGVFMGNTKDASWLEPYRAYYHRLFVELAESTLGRMTALDDSALLEKLSQRAIAIAPEEEQLHRALIGYMFAHGQELQLVRHVTQLAHVGGSGVTWLPAQS